jgi:hypothetical protein
MQWEKFKDIFNNCIQQQKMVKLWSSPEKDMKWKSNQKNSDLFAPSIEVLTSSGSEVCAWPQALKMLSRRANVKQVLTKEGMAPMPSGAENAANRLNIFWPTRTWQCCFHEKYSSQSNSTGLKSSSAMNSHHSTVLWRATLTMFMPTQESSTRSALPSTRLSEKFIEITAAACSDVSKQQCNR